MNITEYSYAIFDMDGTLVNSMQYWNHLADEYLTPFGIPSLEPSLLPFILEATMEEGARAIIEHYHLPDTPENAVLRMNTIMKRHYEYDIPAIPGVKDYLALLQKNGTRMCIASATDTILVKQCLRRLGLLSYFDFVISCEDLNKRKTEPDIYLYCAKKWERSPQEIVVYEDMPFALKTAKGSGFITAAVNIPDSLYDPKYMDCRILFPITIPN